MHQSRLCYTSSHRSSKPAQRSPVLAGKDPKQEFKAGRIPGSRFFDMDGISDPNTDLPHMLPSAGAFAAAADALGISAEDQVCVLAEMPWTHLAVCECPGQSPIVPQGVMKALA